MTINLAAIITFFRYTRKVKKVTTLSEISLFSGADADFEPLANRVRPRNLTEFTGQQQLVGPGKVLRELIEHDQIPSMIFWGPPGVGKTTLASIIAQQTQAKFINLRATTENPSFEINSALLSRAKVFVLQALTSADIIRLLKNALTDPRGYGHQKVEISDECLQIIADFANGDARIGLNTLEMAVLNGQRADEVTTVTKKGLQQLLGKKSLLYDKKGEEHYNMISALHKSMRNSDPDAAVYWLARMLEGGEDPLYVARRLVRFSSEDIGLADSRALELAVATYQACHFIGMPECSVNLTQVVIYLSLAPKSNAAYLAYLAAKKDALNTQAEPVPLQIRNAPTKLMKELNYGTDYQYAHDTEDKLTTMQTMPDNLVGHQYYRPTSQGSEVKFAQRLAQIKRWHQEHDDLEK